MMRARWIVAMLSALALALLTLPVPLPLFDDVHADIEAAGGNGQACPANATPANLNFTLKDTNNRDVSLASYKGKVILLDFWATWCGPCKIEIPWFIEFQKTYRDRDLVVLGVSFDDDGWKSVKPYMEEKKMNYRVVVGDDNVAKLYGGVESLPTTL